MEKEQVKIDIPEGKQPKMTTSDNGVHVEWVDKEKTWEQYVKEYAKEASYMLAGTLDPSLCFAWKKLFKFGLLQYIADDLNEEKLDWGNKTQTKAGLYYHHDDGRIGVDTYYRCHNAAMIFTVKAAEKAINIIPAEFLRTF